MQQNKDTPKDTGSRNGPPVENGRQTNASRLSAFEEPFIPPSPLPLPELSLHISQRIERLLALQTEDEAIKNVQKNIRASLVVIIDALNKFRLEEISLSYNGGKDCLVLLILFLSTLHNHPTQPLASHETIQTVYIVSQDPFPEVEQFLKSTQNVYSLAVSRYTTGMRAALEQYLKEFPKLKAVLVGTRRTDPHGTSLSSFDETDHGWPKFMRVHPVIDWHYQDIWRFITALGIPYCPLYDQGYTSLGGTTDTEKNPALRRQDNQGFYFLPAYALQLDSEERLGREKNTKQSSSPDAVPTSAKS